MAITLSGTMSECRTTLARKLCIGCGKSFRTAFAFKLRCKVGCGRKQERKGRVQARPRPPTQFIGLDGEGITLPNGKHRYVLLTVGTESLTNGGKALTWREIFPFLHAQHLANPRAAFVGYYLGYDFTQWLRSLSQSRAEMLLSKQGIARRQRKVGKNPMPFPVHVGDDSNPWQWEIDILGMKRFMIRPGVKPGKRSKHAWIYVCDVGSFFQQSFIKTLVESRKQDSSICTDKELAIIIEGKRRRSDARLDAKMVAYNMLECRLLERVMNALDGGFRSFGVHLSRRQWMGPGQAAQAWMRMIKAPTSKRVKRKVPAYARDAARATYFGGWFEAFMSGHIPGTTWEYDINSAYPSAIAELPCLLHGRWSRGKGKPGVVRHSLIMVKAAVVGKDRWVGAMLHRAKDGKVLRPKRTAGWYWWHEIRAARRAGLIASVKVEEWVRYDGCKCERPFKAIRELYQKRLEVGKRGPQGKAYKLVYNSSYGKMAQSVGRPAYANAIYASLITCSCRCKVLEAIATHPKRTEHLVKIATDGVYFRSKHPKLEIDSERLGLWSESKKENLTVFMPGLYWDDESRERIRDAKRDEDIDLKLKSRGVPARDIAASVERIDALFRSFKGSWPEISLSISFAMVSPKQALERGKWELCGVVSSDTKRTISSDPSTKRSSFVMSDGTIRTLPYSQAAQLESAAYERSFGEDLEEEQSLDILTPDGLVTDIVKEAILG